MSERCWRRLRRCVFAFGRATGWVHPVVLSDAIKLVLWARGQVLGDPWRVY